MGVDAPANSTFQNNSPYALRWNMDFPSYGDISSLRFYHGSTRSECSTFYGGCNGFNNIPNKVGLRITDQNGVEIFKQVDILVTTCWQWTYIDISHAFLNGGTYTFELLPYGAAGSGGCCNFWNISELYVDGCRDENPCTMNAPNLADVNCVPSSAISFNLNPSVTNGGTTYNVSVSGGAATSVSPTTGTYGQVTNFVLNDNSAGGGDVTVTISNIGDNGCTQNITVTDPGACALPSGCTENIDVTISGNDIELCGGEEITLTANPSTAVTSYLWTSDPPTSITGNTSASITVSPSTTTTYYVSATREEINNNLVTKAGFNNSNFTLINATNSNGTPSSLFDNIDNTAEGSFHAARGVAGTTWGIAYDLGQDATITNIRFDRRNDCCSDRSDGGFAQIFNDGTMVYQSNVVNGSGTGIVTADFPPNIVGDEVRYVFLNGANVEDGGATLNFSEWMIEGEYAEANNLVTGFGFNSSRFALINATISSSTSSTLFDNIDNTAGESFHAARGVAGTTWGISYDLGQDALIQDVSFDRRNDCCSDRSDGGVVQIFNNGTMVYQSDVVNGSGNGIATTSPAPNVIGDEIRYVFLNGANTEGGDAVLNFSEWMIRGSYQVCVGEASTTVTVGGSSVDITTQPSEQIFCTGNTPTFCVTATGTGLSYQWEYSWDGVNLAGNAGEPGNNTSCMSGFGAGAIDAYFRARVTDANGCVGYSDWARLIQGVAPVLTCEYNIDGTVWVAGDCSIELCEGQSLRYSYPGCNANWEIELTGPNGFSVSETGGCGDLLVTNSATTNLSGTYTATVTDINTGCSSSLDVQITVGEGADLTCLHNVNNNTSGPVSEHWNFGNCKPIVCEGDALSLSVLPDGAGTYQWTGPNGFSGTGNANGDILISNNVTSAQAGVYTVTLTDNNGCISTKNIELIISSCFCIDEGGDADGDGICGDNDCEPNNPNIPTAPGTVCDDGNPSNINDLIQANGCDCIGEVCDILADVSPPVYNDNGTPVILTDDTFSFQVTVNGSGTNWVSESHSGLYGETVVFGPYPVDQAGTVIDIRDLQNMNCKVSLGVNMNSCNYTGDCACCED